MRTLKYTISEQHSNTTVKDYARKTLGFSARMLTKQKQLENGILINGVPSRTVDILHSGDVLTFTLPDDAANYQPTPVPLTVLHEDDDYLIVDKPPNMPIHPSPGHNNDSLLNAVAYHYSQTGQAHTFRPLYRLDRDTSGIVVIGKHRSAASAAVVTKRYFAVCQGSLCGSGVVNAPIGLKPSSKIVRECGHGDTAVTHWHALAENNGHTLLSLTLETGRTHQIRVHMSHIGHPLAGDDLYGGSVKFIGRQALHCGFVSISSPALGTKLKIISNFPADLTSAFPWLPSVESAIQED